jgi:uncharacterized protein DUF1566
MLHRIRFILPVFTLLTSLFTLQTAHAATINLPASGQTKCYDSAGAEIASCDGTGQDGDKKMGVTWDEATRFSNNGNGTITDTLTGLIWLQNANCFGTKVWADALTSANTLATGACGLSDGSSAGQWRLPSRKELKSLVNRGEPNSATWLGTKGFSAVQAIYWSSSTYASYTELTDYAWYVTMADGYVNNFDKDYIYYVWPVRGGQ